MRAPKEIEYLKAWGAFVVCATVGGFIVGAVAGGIVGFAITAFKGPQESIPLWGGIAGFITGLPVSYGFFRLFVSKIIVARISRETEEVVPPQDEPARE